MQLIYGVKDRPKWGRLILFSLQQLLAILAATIAVPMIIGNGMEPSAALFGAGVGTIVYLLLTRFRSPVFLGSSFAFLGSMSAAFAGGVSLSLGYLGLLLGALFAGIVYVIIAVIVKFAGVGWINKIMTIVCSVYGKNLLKMIPFIIGILSGYALAAIFTGIGYAANCDVLKVIDFSGFTTLGTAEAWYPNFSFLTAFNINGGGYDAGSAGSIGAYIGSIAVAYIPVAFVVFAEHIADHKNISSIIETDLLKDPGLHRTLLGDGIGSVAGAFFGGCPNTTYGESVGCVAISGNASVITIFVTACMAMACAFLAPFTVFLSSIPKCVMGGVCIALYGFIAVSGLKMIQNVDLGENRNLFVVSVILIAGVGGLTLNIGKVTITSVACSLILGILTNVLVNIKRKGGDKPAEEIQVPATVETEEEKNEEV